MITYPPEALKHKLSKVSGCNPDFNAYTNAENEAPDFTKVLNEVRNRQR